MKATPKVVAFYFIFKVEHIKTKCLVVLNVLKLVESPKLGYKKIFNTSISEGTHDGTYIIEILSNDFQMFTSNNVVVEKTEDDCHVIT